MKKIILITIIIAILLILVFNNKNINRNSLFFGKYEIVNVVETFGTLNLFKTDEEVIEYEKYLKSNLNYDNDKLINNIIEINEKFIKINDNIILENPEYEINIIPSIKIEEFCYKKKFYNKNDIISVNEPYFVYVDVINLDCSDYEKYHYLSSFYLKNNSIILDGDGEFLTRYKAIKLESTKYITNKNVKFDKYTNQLFYGIWNLNYNNNIYNIYINDDIFNIPYKIKFLKKDSLSYEENKIFGDINISNIFCIEFQKNNMYKSIIKNIYIIDENKLIINIKDSYYELDRVDSIWEYDYSNGV